MTEPGSDLLRDTAFIRVAAGPEARAGIFQTASAFRAEILEAGPESVVLACRGGAEPIRALVASLKPYGPLAIGRAGDGAWSFADPIAMLAPEGGQV